MREHVVEAENHATNRTDEKKPARRPVFNRAKLITSKQPEQQQPKQRRQQPKQPKRQPKQQQLRQQQQPEQQRQLPELPG